MACVIMWFLWRERNNKVHGSRGLALDNLVQMACEWLLEFQTTRAALEERVKYPEKLPPYWTPPPLGQLKLYVDVACFSLCNSTGIGVVQRDHKGIVVAAFTRKFTSSFAPLVAEALVIREG